MQPLDIKRLKEALLHEKSQTHRQLGREMPQVSFDSTSDGSHRPKAVMKRQFGSYQRLPPMLKRVYDENSERLGRILLKSPDELAKTLPKRRIDVSSINVTQ